MTSRSTRALIESSATYTRAMTALPPTSVEAIFSGGVLRPLQPLSLQEDERVRVTIEKHALNGSTPDDGRARLISGFDRMQLHSGGVLPRRDDLHDRG